MLDTTTEKNLKNIIKPLEDNAKWYRKIMDNCSMYMVKPNGNKYWLADNWILAEYKECAHSNPFESWKYPDAKIAKENFKLMSFDNNW
tara:strand:+ start:740 stop:1003 length:264 start_codon:yes stop_codon:yes gene_type:complete